jgi:hypothetical protein
MPLGRTWGTAVYGGSWSEWSPVACSTADNYKVVGGEAVMLVGSAIGFGSNRCQKLDTGQTDVEFTGSVSLAADPAGTAGSIFGYLAARAQDINNMYRVRVEFPRPAGGSPTAKCLLQKFMSPTTTDFGTPQTIAGYNGSPEKINLKIQVVGVEPGRVRAKCWAASEAEPDWGQAQTFSVSDSDLDTGTNVVARASSGSGISSNEVKFDDLDAHSPGEPTIAAVGDIACRGTADSFNGGNGNNSACQQRWTSDLICGANAAQCNTSDSGGTGYDKVLALGDLQYDCGDYEEFVVGDESELTDGVPLSASWAYAPGGLQNSWSRLGLVPGLLAPVPGNHEYQLNGEGSCSLHTSNTRGHCYFGYFNSGSGTGDAGDLCAPATSGPANPDGTVVGSQPGGYYSYDLGTWKIIGLNSGENCDAAKSPSCITQTNWLTNAAQTGVLDTNTQPCILAYWHHPRWDAVSDNPGGDAEDSLDDWWVALVNAHADVVLNGHKHWYERWDKLDASGDPSPTAGMRQFVVGTGGKDHHTRNASGGTGGVVYNDRSSNATFGVLELVLNANSYQYRFRASTSGGTPTNGNFEDPDTTPDGGLSAPVQCNP